MKTQAKSSIEWDQFDLAPEVKNQVKNLIQSLKNEIKQLEAKNQALVFELAQLRRIRFGVKSEAMSVTQLSLFDEDYQTDVAAIETEIEQLPLPQSQSQKTKRPRAGRQPLPDHLPRIEHRHEPDSCQCQQCGNALTKIGEDVTEQLDVEPAKFFVHRHIRPQYACRACETIVAEPVPPAVIDGGMAATGLLAWLITSKYLDHLPLYRIAQIAARNDVTLSISTLAEWVGRVGVALQPLADRLTEHLLQRQVLHADESVPRRRTGGEIPSRSYAAQEMRVGPSESPYRRRLQTTYCCCV